ncbi:F-box/kelch-repeat protein At3g24760 isoform X1 [Cryptomeria japonica]|uniref:F-box/kelch-repeat protein At3g24760 isoform X1 n=1 Tax=Cryptomeria japonica TaxID=3369 RepID=UPI0027DA2BD7|nr:F-box/kelch-repeat protein At3g24760 isoform X1 [Cryptomeria japonica]
MDKVCSQPRCTEHEGWSRLNPDTTEFILSCLPISSIISCCTVCKQWYAIATEPSFGARLRDHKKPWFFLYGQNNIFLKNNQAFGFDPEAHKWIRLPVSSFPESCAGDSLAGSGGFLFATTGSDCSRFCYAPVFAASWKETAPMRFSRRQPLVGVFNVKKNYGFIVVGGSRFVGGLVDIEDRLAVEIYDSGTDEWELCAPLPAEFRSGNSSQWLTSALLNGKFYVFGIFSGFMSAFDLELRSWDMVRILRPAGILFSFLIPCQGRLILAGLKNTADGPGFDLWKIDEETMGLCEVGSMPKELLYSLFDNDEEDKFASLKCVGLGSLIYVFNEEHHKMYPACVCEVSERLECRWMKIPPLPVPVNRFHRVISFCSIAAVDSILGRKYPMLWGNEALSLKSSLVESGFGAERGYSSEQLLAIVCLRS